MHPAVHRVNLLRKLYPDDKPNRFVFADNTLDRTDSHEEGDLKRALFSKRATFNVYGILTRNNENKNKRIEEFGCLKTNMHSV